LLYIDQTQSASYQRFQMPLDVVVNGTTYKVFNDADPDWYVIPLPAPATTVQLDPDAWVLTGAVTTTTYVAGPPKIVATAPAPGQTYAGAASTNTVAVTFHANVNTTAANYNLVGATGGTIPVSFAYNSGTFTTTLTAVSNLPPDTYTFTVSDALTAVSGGKHLDGEITDPYDPNALPSGNGTEGGAATISFVVQGSRGDMNCDGTVDFADINPFVLYLSNLATWQTTYPACPPQNGDLNADGTYPSFGDINPFVALLNGN
jgi:hypothetical protein